ncbi:hypothetical protein SAMN05192544_110311 [Paraburkholderia hospita]|nr:hypothetical protein SAMN05192544_110311 [Paraburkholderia hospita]
MRRSGVHAAWSTTSRRLRGTSRETVRECPLAATRRRSPPGSGRPSLPRLAWGSVIAGVILSMIVYLVMSALGAPIGAPLLAPLSKPRPLQGFGLGPGGWMIVTTVLAVFVGPYTPPNWLRCHGLRETVARVLAADASVHITGLRCFLRRATSA